MQCHRRSENVHTTRAARIYRARCGESRECSCVTSSQSSLRYVFRFTYRAVTTIYRLHKQNVYSGRISCVAFDRTVERLPSVLPTHRIKMTILFRLSSAHLFPLFSFTSVAASRFAILLGVCVCFLSSSVSLRDISSVYVERPGYDA